MLNAAEMGFPYNPENKLGYKICFALKGGYPVGHVYDASPALQRVPTKGDRTPVYKTVDHGLTWEVCGYYKDGPLSEPNSHDCYISIEDELNKL